jgi:hypothetical protein
MAFDETLLRRAQSKACKVKKKVVFWQSPQKMKGGAKNFAIIKLEFLI